MSTWMLYGANGYTGELIAERAAAAGDRPILAGRRAEAIEPIASRLGLPHRVFGLDDANTIAAQLHGVDAVLLCAGPFSRTSAPVVQACLDTGTHYLDITGELEVFDACHQRGAEAERAGCVILPGVGFDVVPSDCLAATLAAALPGADALELAFHGVGSPSKGTARTMLENVPRGVAVRENGRVVDKPLGWKTADIPFRDKTRSAVTIRWGDVVTAYYSTGIPNITVYMAAPRGRIRQMQAARYLRPVLAAKPVQRFLTKQIDKRVKGPDAHQRTTGQSQLWGRVRKGDIVREGTLVTPEGYELTAMTALDSVRRVAAGEVKAGAHTPSLAFGADYIQHFDGCDLRVEGGLGTE